MKGIPNFGNTCYFNSALQCLFQIPRLTNYLIPTDYIGPCEFTREYQRLVRIAWTSKIDRYIDTRPILRIFRTRFSQFNNDDQQDAQEALMCMLELLEPIVKPLFTCKLSQETLCSSGKTIIKDETMVLTLAPKETLEKSFEEFTKWHTLENYEDNDGKVWNVAVTRTVFETFPDVLIIALTHKQTIQVCEKFNKYKLFASCVHVGNQNGGHYMAYTKHKGKWYLKDDLQCVESDFPETSGHCILFYKVTV
jgi:ubiquitin C-terminal hydrolase